VFLKTAEFAVARRFYLPRFAIVTPFPNTPRYRRLAAEGRILTHTGNSTTASTSFFNRRVERPRHCSSARIRLETRLPLPLIAAAASPFSRAVAGETLR